MCSCFWLFVYSVLFSQYVFCYSFLFLYFHSIYNTKRHTQANWLVRPDDLMAKDMGMSMHAQKGSKLLIDHLIKLVRHRQHNERSLLFMTIPYPIHLNWYSIVDTKNSKIAAYVCDDTVPNTSQSVRHRRHKKPKIAAYVCDDTAPNAS